LGNDSTLALSTTNVLVNHTNTPKGDLDVAASTNAVHLVLRGRSADNAGQAEFWSHDGATRYGVLGSTPSFSLFGSIANTFLYFITNSTERMRITADGYVRLATTSSGIQFNGDTAAANALDDYEEGTFTVTLTPSTSGSIGGTPTFTDWTYTKIGRKVTINGVFVVNAVSSPVGTSIIIGGLPFTILNNNGAYGSLSCTYFAFATSINTSEPSRHTINTTSLIISKNASTVALNDEIYVTATYFV
jgi:hypothetical protein